MADVTGVGVNRAGGGMLGLKARTQYAAMARMRWRIFMNGLRSIHGLRDLAAPGSRGCSIPSLGWVWELAFVLALTR